MLVVETKVGTGTRLPVVAYCHIVYVMCNCFCLAGIPTVCRRRADTLHVAHLWAAIEHIRDTRQVANFDRISRYLLRHHNMLERETADLLRFASKEQLIRKYKSVSRKLSSAATEQCGYRIPDTEANLVRVNFFNLTILV